MERPSSKNPSTIGLISDRVLARRSADLDWWAMRAGQAGRCTGRMINFTDLSKQYRGTTALDRVSFAVPEGSVTGFLGPNGAGKTTAMRILLGHSRPTSGTATVLGQPYSALANPGYQVGSLLDAGAQHPGRSGRESLRLSALMLGVPRSRVDEVLDLVGLTSAEGRRVFRAYSLGMRQRLGIAQALLGEPRVLVLDEPANGLDPQGIQWLRNLLRQLADNGCSVLLSSHLIHEVSQIADRVVVIGRGRILAQGTLAELDRGDGLEETFFRLTNAVDRSAA